MVSAADDDSLHDLPHNAVRAVVPLTRSHLRHFCHLPRPVLRGHVFGAGNQLDHDRSLQLKHLAEVPTRLLPWDDLSDDFCFNIASDRSRHGLLPICFGLHLRSHDRLNRRCLFFHG